MSLHRRRTWRAGTSGSGRWRELGRYVRKGEKAITLCRPVTVRRTRIAEDDTEQSETATWFLYKPYWFVLAQTEGADLPLLEIPNWNRTRALDALNVTAVPFDATDDDEGVIRRSEARIDQRDAKLTP